MIIYVDNRPALLKSGSSFEYISENRLFLGRDGYTLTLTFPLRDCPQNRAIFGHIERMDVSKEKLLYECAISDKGVSLFGTLQVVGIDNTGVKAQFSEGRCEQTVNSSLDDIYINALDLGQWPTSSPSEISAQAALRPGATTEKSLEVALPWVNSAHPEPIQNLMVHGEHFWEWAEETTAISWQPSLLLIAERICRAIGYDYDFSIWADSNFRYLIVCNTLPAAWNMPEYARVMPSWTVAEFFEKLELFMNCEFDFDHRARLVRFSFSKSAVNSLPEVVIPAVVDTYDAEISKDESPSCEYIGAKRLIYKDTGHQLSNYYSCDWLFKGSLPNAVVRYNSFQELYDKNITNGVKIYGQNLGEPLGPPDDRLQDISARHPLYDWETDTYLTFRTIGFFEYQNGDVTAHNVPKYILQPFNVFGSRINEDVEDIEIEFVPVCIDHTDDTHGMVMFLSFSDYNEDSSSDTGSRQPFIASKIESGEKEKVSSFYDVIYVAFWPGANPSGYTGVPSPVIDKVAVTHDGYMLYDDNFSMRRYDNAPFALDIPKINPRQKFKFSFLSDTIPNPRSVFNIAGHRYVCEKITATFTEDGMSQLLKGEFYPLLED